MGGSIGGADGGDSGGGGGSDFVVTGATGVAHSSSSAGGSVSITFNGGSGSCTPSTPGLTAVAGTGNTVQVNGSNYPANTDATVSIASDPVVLGALTADASGAFAGTFTVPCTVGAGAHTVTATATGGTTASAPVTLTGCAVLAQPTFTG